MATRSSILAWKIPWMVEPGRLQTMDSQRVGHDWATSLNRHQRKKLNSFSGRKKRIPEGIKLDIKQIILLLQVKALSQSFSCLLNNHPWRDDLEQRPSAWAHEKLSPNNMSSFFSSFFLLSYAFHLSIPTLHLFFFLLSYLS